MLTWPVKQNTPLNTLKHVHRWAMDHFIYVEDTTRWDINFALNGDHWETNAELTADLELHGAVRGDCDAFAKLCWMALLQLDIPARLVFCLTPNNAGHLVCESSGWILDNRMWTLVPRKELEYIGYTWISKSGYHPGEQWTTMEA